ncbi:MAG: LCP family protein [Clostridia bacterium]|nr:LCP family protein [Clostridia bacterium]
MKKLLCWLMTLCLILPTIALGEEEEDLIIEEVVEEVLLELDLDSDDVYVDEDTGETFYLTEEEQQKLDALMDEEEEEEDDAGIDPDSLDLNPNLPENVINILLVGVDTRSKDPQEIIGRGDTQIIVSINKDTGAIKMTSILRDSLVPIPGYKNQTKINNAFQYGCNKVKKGTTKEKVRSGAALAMRTINKNFQMNIENYVAINFNGLASIIDSLGGIDIELTKGEAWYINKYLKEHPPAYDNKAKGERTPLEVVAGTQHLDGVQAVMYARTRSLKGENDFNRTDRQRHLLDLLLQKVLAEFDPLDMIDLVGTAADYSDTNMNLQFMVELAFSLLPTLSSAAGGESLFEQMRVPMDHSYSYTTANGSSVIKYNLTKHAQAIHEFVYGTYYPAK